MNLRVCEKRERDRTFQLKIIRATHCICLRKQKSKIDEEKSRRLQKFLHSRSTVNNLNIAL